MNRPPAPSPAQSSAPLYLAGAILVGAVLLAYHNSFTGPFVFDDGPAIVNNPSLRPPWTLGELLLPKVEDGATVAGRPLVNLSLAFNHAMGGEHVVGYHVVNLLIHLGTALLLMGVLRRTLLLPVLARSFGGQALVLAASAAGLWAVHPLQTESVTYIVQRAESLMGLCYLATLYGFLRGTAADRPAGWFGLSVVACFAGMLSKETMVSAPLMVLLYDRTFVAGTFGAAWRARRGYYLALALTWVPLLALVFAVPGRGSTAGLGTAVTPWEYLLTQCQAVVLYLKLSFWPAPLVFDYGTGTVAGLGAVWWQALLLLTLAGATLWALGRRPVWGFLGAWFFALLAPSSSFVPVASQTMAEHRMYLPLAAVVVMVLVGVWLLLKRHGWIVAAGLAGMAMILTMARNEVYRSELALWTDTVAHYPANARAHNNLGQACLAAGRVEEAIRHSLDSIALRPAAPEPHYNLGLALMRAHRPAEAIARYEEAIRLQPAYAEAHNNLGNALLALGRPQDALGHYERAAILRPGLAEAHSNLANLLPDFNRAAEAVQHGETAARLAPADAGVRFNLGNALARAGRPAEALAAYEQALRLRPDHAEAANNRANVLAEQGRLPEAIAAYEQALRLSPGFADPRRNLVQILLHLGRPVEVRQLYQRLLQQRPDDAELRAESAAWRTGP